MYWDRGLYNRSCGGNSLSGTYHSGNSSSCPHSHCFFICFPHWGSALHIRQRHRCSIHDLAGTSYISYATNTRPLTDIWRVCNLQAVVIRKCPAELLLMLFYSFFIAILSAASSLIFEKDLSAWSLNSTTRLIPVIYSVSTHTILILILVMIMNSWWNAAIILCRPCLAMFSKYPLQFGVWEEKDRCLHPFSILWELWFQSQQESSSWERHSI